MNRNTSSSRIRNHAQRLLDYEGALRSSSPSGAATVSLVVERLRRPLSTLVGLNGFSVLLARALTLAKMEIPRLSALEVRPDGSIEGLGELQSGEVEAGVLLIGHVLGLLATFIGEGLMLQILLDVWPDLALSQNVSSGDREHDPRK